MHICPNLGYFPNRTIPVFYCKCDNFILLNEGIYHYIFSSITYLCIHIIITIIIIFYNIYTFLLSPYSLSLWWSGVHVLSILNESTVQSVYSRQHRLFTGINVVKHWSFLYKQYLLSNCQSQLPHISLLSPTYEKTVPAWFSGKLALVSVVTWCPTIPYSVGNKILDHITIFKIVLTNSWLQTYLLFAVSLIHSLWLSSPKICSLKDFVVLSQSNTENLAGEGLKEWWLLEKGK